MPYFGEIIALITAFLWSGTSFAFMEAAKRIGSLQLNINRMILASLFLMIIILEAGFSTDLSLKQVEYLIVSGFVGLVFGDSFLFKAFQLIGARLGMLIMALVPAMSSLLAFFFLDESLSILAITGMAITISGIVFVVVERSSESIPLFRSSPLGIFYGVLGALGQAGGLILAKFAFTDGELNGFVAAFIRLSSAVLIFFPVVLLIKRYKNPIRLYKKNIPALKATVIGTILGPVLGITCSLVAIANTKIGIASTLMSLMPVIMLPIARYYYKEKLNFRAIAGAFIAVIGVIVLFMV
ncbi:DMT family transporter [bacterium BMS3Abin03]|nr:DMT family transporter [bacterium BMS3Abin03]